MIESLFRFTRAPNGLYMATESFAEANGKVALESVLNDLSNTSSLQWEKLELKNGTLYYAAKQAPSVWILRKPRYFAGLKYLLSVEGLGTTYAPEVDRFAKGLYMNYLENERSGVKSP